MDIAGMKQKVTEFWNAFNRGDLDGQLGLMTEDAVFIMTGTTPVSGVKSGKKAVRGHFEDFGRLVKPGGVMKIQKLVAEGDTVVCLSEGKMTGRTGTNYNNRYVFVFQLDKGKISAVTEYLDTELVETALYGRKMS